MRTILASILLFFTSSLAAMACPNAEFGGATFTYSGTQLATPQSHLTAALGGYDVSTCPLGGAFAAGYAGAAPNYTLNLSGMDGMALELSVNAQCDSTMLVYTADGTWLFDDDSNGNLDPYLQITSAIQSNGSIGVWIGTYDNATCQATLNIASIAGGGQTTIPAVPTPAGGCPSWENEGAAIDATAATLGNPANFPLTAMGGADLFNCPEIPDGRGYAPEAPQYSFYLSAMDGYELDLSLQSNCDTVMVVNAADTTWYFDDDGGEVLNSRLRIPGGLGLDGRLDVWVGTYGGESCPATLTAAAVQGGAVVPLPPAVPGTAGVAGCPAAGATGQLITSTGETLYSPQSYTVQASGATDLSNCPEIGQVFGYADATPDYSFDLSGMEEYGRLEIEVFSDCDPILLVRSADGQWHFNDDSEGLDPMLNISGAFAMNGRVDVWVGAWGGNACSATLEMETWYQ